MAIFMANVENVGYRIDTQTKYIQIPENDLLQVLHNFKRNEKGELEEESHLGFTVHPKEIKNRLDSRHFDPRILKTINVLKNYSHARLGDISHSPIKGKAPRIYVESGIPVITIENIVKRNEFYFLNLTDVRYITKEAHEKAKETKIKEGDILLVITGATIGKVTVVPKYLKEGNICGDILKVTLREKVSPYYVAAFLSSKYGQIQIFKHICGSTNMHLDPEGIKSIIITIHPNQKEIGRKLEQIEDTLERTNELLRELKMFDFVESIKNSSLHFSGRL